MKMSEIVVGMLLFSGVLIGMTNFYAGTATNYAGSNPELENMSDSLSQTEYIEDQMKEIRGKLNSFDPTNPLSWGNFLSTMINVFNVMISLPGVFNSMIVYITETLLFLPAWVASFIYVIILAVVIFAAISALNKYKV